MPIGLRLVSSPPYTSFRTFKLALAYLIENGAPAKFDRSVWRQGFGPGAAAQLSGAFLFMGLVEKDGAATPALAPLLKAYQTSEWGGALENVLRTAYAPLFDLALEEATFSQIAECFQVCYAVEGVRRRKCAEFFLNALRETELILSSYLDSKYRGGFQPNSVPSTQQVTSKLIDRFPPFDPAWPDRLKERWLAGFLELVQRTKGPG